MSTVLNASSKELFCLINDGGCLINDGGCLITDGGCVRQAWGWCWRSWQRRGAPVTRWCCTQPTTVRPSPPAAPTATTPVSGNIRSMSSRLHRQKRLEYFIWCFIEFSGNILMMI